MSAHDGFIIYPQECLRHMKRAVKFAGETGIPIVNFGEGWLPRLRARRGKKVTEEEAEKYGFYLGLNLTDSSLQPLKE